MLLVAGTRAVAQTNVVIDATVHRSIGGVGTLDRAKYFNHWGSHTSGMGGLADELTSPTGLNTVTGRETFEYDGLIASGLGEDPSNPGFFKHSDLVGKLQGSYKNWVLNDSRWESLREHPNPVLVQSGRAIGAWPAWIREGTPLPIKGAGAAYGDFLNVYLEEVVFGTGPGQGYLPFDKDRFYVEIMNEPQLELRNGVDWNDVIEFHKNVTIAVKEQHPEAKIGGASVGEAPFPSWNPHRWDLAKQMMDDMTTWRDSSNNPVEFDFWTFHPYDVHRVRSTGGNAGNMETQVRESVGHLEGMMDLFESYSDIKFGDPKEFAVTEYGATIYTENGSQNFGSYTRTRRQWDQVRDVKKKLMVFMDRPDRIINATPFVAPQWYTESSPTEESGAHYAMWERLPNGAYQETILGGMYRMFNDVQGDYVGINTDNPALQTAAFRDGNQLHIILNNLNDSLQSVDLQALVGSATVTGATMDRLVWNGTQGIFVDNMDVTSSWQNLTMTGEEGAKLTLTFDESIGFGMSVNEQTFYGDDVQTPINLAGSKSKVINIDADTDSAVSARMRIGIAERSNIWNESFQIVVNGNAVAVPATGPSGFDDSDVWLFSREVDVPLAFLNNGNNEVFVDFNSNGGQLVTTSLIVTSDTTLPGDFNGDSLVNSQDLGLWSGAFGLNAAGDADGDGDTDSNDFLAWQRNLSPSSLGAFAAVPEPSSLVLLTFASLLAKQLRLGRRRPKQSH